MKLSLTKATYKGKRVWIEGDNPGPFNYDAELGNLGHIDFNLGENNERVIEHSDTD